MKVTVISDQSDHTPLGAAAKAAMTEMLQSSGHQFSLYDLCQDDLHHCIGCFHCWVKDPGRCVFDDTGRKLNQSYMESDVAIILSPVRFGCYSMIIRRFFDRSLPVILPFFKEIDGTVHHAPRYEHYPELIVVGYGENLTGSEKETFNALANANAANFQVRSAKTYFCTDEQTVQPVKNAIASYIKVICNLH